MPTFSLRRWLDFWWRQIHHLVAELCSRMLTIMPRQPHEVEWCSIVPLRFKLEDVGALLLMKNARGRRLVDQYSIESKFFGPINSVVVMSASGRTKSLTTKALLIGETNGGCAHDHDCSVKLKLMVGSNYMCRIYHSAIKSM